jgi:hypothetical protein
MSSCKATLTAFVFDNMSGAEIIIKATQQWQKNSTPQHPSCWQTVLPGDPGLPPRAQPLWHLVGGCACAEERTL